MAEYTPIATPIWLADPDLPAPCPCGRPMFVGEPLVQIEGDHGLTRVVHASCLQRMMEGGYDVDDE